MKRPMPTWMLRIWDSYPDLPVTDELARFEDDGGRPLARVVICTGCGATEKDPSCYCGC